MSIVNLCPFNNGVPSFQPPLNFCNAPLLNRSRFNQVRDPVSSTRSIGPNLQIHGDNLHVPRPGLPHLQIRFPREAHTKVRGKPDGRSRQHIQHLMCPLHRWTERKREREETDADGISTGRLVWLAVSCSEEISGRMDRHPQPCERGGE